MKPQWNGPIITFVTPWYGPDVPGGAELQCRRTAEELCARGITAEVFTTTAGGLATDWTNPAFPIGTTNLNGVLVHRFPVRQRNGAVFDLLNAHLLSGGRLSLAEEAVFVREIVGSDELEAAIATDSNKRLFIFIPYMFGTTYWGAQFANRAYMIPCLHAEAYADMLLYRRSLESAYALMFYSPAEQRLAHRLLHIDGRRTLLLGAGVETDMAGDAQRFRERFGIREPFIVYVGRRDPTKNTPLLIDYFRRYRAEGGMMQLVCVGGPGTPLPSDLVDSGVAHELGFLPAQLKYDAYAAAEITCQPSLHESFSLIIMESWVCGTPALVHSDCDVTREFCELSKGGLHFRSYLEFAGCLETLLARPSLAQKMGQSGQEFVSANFSWNQIIERLLVFLRSVE